MTNVKENYFSNKHLDKARLKKKHGYYKASQMAISLCPIEYSFFFYQKT
jgi:hypothetical protein